MRAPFLLVDGAEDPSLRDPLLSCMDRVRTGQREDPQFKDIISHLDSGGVWPADDKRKRDSLAVQPYRLEDGLLYRVDSELLRLVIPDMSWETPSRPWGVILWIVCHRHEWH